jgi:hypothetical protein
VVHTELGRSQGEVQRCILSWEVGKELGEESWQSAWRAEVQVEIDADMVEEKLEEETKRRTRRKSRRTRRSEPRTTLIKSNNPHCHLAGGEISKNWLDGFAFCMDLMAKLKFSYQAKMS